MIDVTLYASFDSVRAALGVAIKELPDAVLSTDIFSYFVQDELDGIAESLRPDFEAITPPGSSAEEVALYDAVRVFSAYAVAYRATDSLPLFSPKTITEGKASLSRHADSPYKQVVIEVRKAYIYYKKLLEELVDDVVITSVPATLMSTSSPDYDPVTGS